MLDAGFVEERLRRIDWSRLGVCHVLLIGSLVRKGRGGDVDILVFPCRRGPLDHERLLEVVLVVSRELGLDPSLVDVVDAGRAPCPLLVEAARHHRVVYTVDRSTLIDELLRLLSLCEDEEVSAKHLKLYEVALEAAARRWGRWASSRGSTKR